MTVNEIKNAKIKAWIEECVKMCEPDNVVVVDGTTAEYDRSRHASLKALTRSFSGVVLTLNKKRHRFRCLLKNVLIFDERNFYSHFEIEAGVSLFVTSSIVSGFKIFISNNFSFLFKFSAASDIDFSIKSGKRFVTSDLS